MNAVVSSIQICTVCQSFLTFLFFFSKCVDNAIRNTSQHVSDDDCRMVRFATHTEYCGNVNRLTIYQSSTFWSSPRRVRKFVWQVAIDVGNWGYCTSLLMPMMAKLKNLLTQASVQSDTSAPTSYLLLQLSLWKWVDRDGTEHSMDNTFCEFRLNYFLFIESASES
jgi:hypothetical protein